MPRVSIRKLFVYLLAIASCVLLALNIQQRASGLFTSSLTPTGPGSSGPSAPPPGPQPVHLPLNKVPEEEIQPKKKLDGTVLDPSDHSIPDLAHRPWYMKNGEIRPTQCKVSDETGQRIAKVLPNEAPEEDRIPEQLMYVPPEGFIPENMEDSEAPLKTILMWNGLGSWGGLRPGRGVFLKEKCPVSSCVISSNRIDGAKADLVVFKDHFTMPSFSRPPEQLWMLYLLECPLHTQMFKQKYVFNWTSTYRRDSTIVAPYERWQYYNENVKSIEQGRDIAANKTKAVAWFVSNCGARNGRLNYAKELSKYIEVDIYGACGTKRCPRVQSNTCFDMLNRDYKFYLAFENSNCKDYITEKFFVNGLSHDVIPIVMGARPQDYAVSAPYKSYIHVDDFDGPKELAEYLHKLDQDDQLYNEYFKWKGTGEFINTKFFCRVCSMLHDPKVQTEPFSYPDINEWWRGKGVCINGNWRKFQKSLEADAKKKQLKSSSDKPENASKPAPDDVSKLSDETANEEAKPPAKLP